MREARARFAELLDDAERGNVTLITRHGRTAAAIVPVALLGQLGEAGAGGALPDPEAGPALRAAVASLRDALGALEPLLPRNPIPRFYTSRRMAGTTGNGRHAGTAWPVNI